MNWEVSTVADLEALPIHTQVLDRDAEPLKKVSATGWWWYTEQRDISSEELATARLDDEPLFVPVTVVYQPPDQN